jgi:hypothetical protein
MAALFSRVWGYLAAVGAVLVAVLTIWTSGRRAGRDAVTAEAARRGEEARVKGDAAARDAQREGAASRMRRGEF